MRTYSASITYRAANAGTYSRTSVSGTVPPWVQGPFFEVRARNISHAFVVAEADASERADWITVTTPAGVEYGRRVSA